MIIQSNQLLIHIILYAFLKRQKKLPLNHPFPLLFLDLPQYIKKHSLLRSLPVPNKENDSIVGSASEAAKYTITQFLITLFFMYLIDLHALFRQAPEHHHVPFELTPSLLLPYAGLIWLGFDGMVMVAGFGLFPD